MKPKIMNLHELVDESIRIDQTLKSFKGHFHNGGDHDLKFLENYDKLFTKLDNLYSKIMLQFPKEDSFVALYELKRMNDPTLCEKSMEDVLIEEFSHE